MIGKVARGTRVGGLLRYLFGPGRANEHTNPHLAAAFDDASVLEPPTGANGARDMRALTSLLEQPLRADPRPPEQPVWHCSLRVAPGDRALSDAEWDDVARTVLDAVGLAPRGDDAGCRWVAVRHAEDHVHLVVTLARQDARRVSTWNDYYKVGEACRAVEAHYGLTLTPARDRTAARRPTRGEQEKAHRVGRTESARTHLQRTARTAAAAAGSPEEFITALRASGVLVRERFSTHTPGQVTGYAVALPEDRNQDGQPVWFGGGKLAPDLSWPQLQQRWDAASAPAGPVRDGQQRVTQDGLRRQPLTAAQRAAAYRSATHIANHAAIEVRALAVLEPAAARHTATATADLLNSTAHLLEGPGPGPVTTAADAFDRAAREPWRKVPPRSPDGRALRACARTLARLGRARTSDRPQILPLLAAIADLADAVAQLRAAQHRDAQADAAHRAAAALRTSHALLGAPTADTRAQEGPRPGAPPRPRTPGRQPALWMPGAR